ncbi:hypothetical protein CABS01_13665 [Colletotrichum abscissum]|uniref:Uncharacterized protein n=1 Tax=Colletotrichum abscissum TaxID=1671311 RepID=A0A9Q0B9Y8_9PEZI|nr:uncharacterized protein CABS01_13665 [Colletotrichum abscissum]KAI3559038.1 hypothetical protein CABS02_00013 [Colletotrichum abscissum]KAK1484908.1 hypothetical protein CABS01_13665 [Colletotrichum abscissum]
MNGRRAEVKDYRTSDEHEGSIAFLILQSAQEHNLDPYLGAHAERILTTRLSQGHRYSIATPQNRHSLLQQQQGATVDAMTERHGQTAGLRFSAPGTHRRHLKHTLGAAN